MRFPKLEEDLVGKIAVCSIGRVAIITNYGKIEKSDGSSIAGWEGIGFDGKGTWFSTSPVIVAETGDEFRNKLRDRFGGKMSFNG